VPPDAPPGSAANWLARARSSLALAKVPKPNECLWEDLCFHAQQAAEKALKAVLVHRGLTFRFVHDLNELLSDVQAGGVSVPDRLRSAGTLNEFAVMTRYPGPCEAVGESDYRRAVELA
jgi:HEPN domain-containing protein